MEPCRVLKVTLNVRCAVVLETARLVGEQREEEFR